MINSLQKYMKKMQNQGYKMIIKIGNKKYIGQCNALSYMFHKKIFKISIFDDLIILKECLMNQRSSEDFYNVLIRLIYTLIYTNNSALYSFEQFKEEIMNETISSITIDEIIKLYLESFFDNEALEELEKTEKKETTYEGKNEEKEVFPEHEFIVSCMNFGLNIEALKELTYIDIVKMMITTRKREKENKKTKYRMATQEDWDRLAQS